MKRLLFIPLMFLSLVVRSQSINSSIADSIATAEAEAAAAAAIDDNESVNRVQDTFFGLKFGASGKAEMMEKFKGYQCINKQDYLEYYDIEFGGFDFFSVRFEYLYDAFNSCIFSSHYKDKTVANAKYQQVCSALEKKYFLYDEIIKTNGKYRGFMDENNGVSISLEKALSRSGEIFYYVELNYWNRDLTKAKDYENGNKL